MLRASLLAVCLVLPAPAAWSQNPPLISNANDESTVRKELEQAYEKLNLANVGGDLEGVLAMKTSDFHTISPDGTVSDFETMKQYSARFMKNNSAGLKITITIQRLRVSEHGLIAVADVLQEAVRQRELGGKVRELRTTVLQRETWSRTSAGWKLKLVDDVHDGKTFVDGKRVDPKKPYDPETPPFVPPKEEK